MGKAEGNAMEAARGKEEPKSASVTKEPARRREEPASPKIAAVVKQESTPRETVAPAGAKKEAASAKREAASPREGPASAEMEAARAKSEVAQPREEAAGPRKEADRPGLDNKRKIDPAEGATQPTKKPSQTAQYIIEKAITQEKEKTELKRKLQAEKNDTQGI